MIWFSEQPQGHVRHSLPLEAIRFVYARAMTTFGASRTASHRFTRCVATRSRPCASCSRFGICVRHRARRPLHFGGREPAHQAHRRARQMAFPVHVHMLRHACGYALANAGHDTRALPRQHPAHRYTELAPEPRKR